MENMDKVTEICELGSKFGLLVEHKLDKTGKPIIIISNKKFKDRSLSITIKSDIVFAVEKKKDLGGGYTELMQCENGNWEAVVSTIEELAES